MKIIVLILVGSIIIYKSSKASKRIQNKIEELHSSIIRVAKETSQIKDALDQWMRGPSDKKHKEPISEKVEPTPVQKTSDELVMKPLSETKPSQSQEPPSSRPKEMTAPKIAQKAPAAPKPKSKLAEGIETILKKIWNWILVGEDYRPKNVSLEYAVASTWLMRLGITAIVFCIGYFLKWSMAHGLLGPNGRIALSIVFGIGMLLLGLRNLNKKYHILGQGFIGGGLAALYFSMYAAGPLYGKVTMELSFVLMILVTIVAGLLALKTNSQLIAIFGIIGGFLTPVILSTGETNFAVLYSYLLLLGIGILGISHKEKWHLLNYLGFVFTWILFWGSLRGYESHLHFSMTLTFLTLIFILHSMLVYYYNLIQRKKTTSLEIGHLICNTLFYTATSYHLIVDAVGRPWPALMAIGLSAFYIAQIYVMLARQFHDRNLLVSLIGLAGFFAVWAIPLITEKETLTICWAIQALLFLWIGLRLNSNLLVTLAAFLNFLVMGRLLIFDIPLQFGRLNYAETPMIEYWKTFFDRAWTFCIVIASFFGSFVLHKRHVKQSQKYAVSNENNVPMVMTAPVFRGIMFWGGALFLFSVLYLEAIQMFGYYVPLKMPMLTLLWCLLGIFLLTQFKSNQSKVLYGFAVAILGIVLFKLFVFDFAAWGYYRMGPCVYSKSGTNVLMRLLDYGFIFILIWVFLESSFLLKKQTHRKAPFLVVGTLLFFTYASLEVNTFFYWYIPDFQKGSISVLWALFAIAFLLIGLFKTNAAWRYAGLVLFLIVVVKVFLIDLAGMAVFYRVIAFMILGVLLLGGSFAYIKASKKFLLKESQK